MRNLPLHSLSSTLLALALCTTSLPAAPPATRSTFRNPVIPQDSPDPWVIRHEGFYYFTATFDAEGGIWVWKSPTLTGLDSSTKVKVWTAPPTGPNSRAIWAPELYHFDGRWYLYYTASDGPNKNHRMFVLESKTDDPLGEYIDRGPVDPDAGWAIDGSVLVMPDGRRYWMETTGKLVIAPMTSPTRVDHARRVDICEPTYPWERGWVEAPQALVKNGRVFIIYSAGHSATPHYSLGMLTLRKGADPLDPKAWTKSPFAVFAPYFGPEGAAYNVGHNSFTTSPDGKEDWIVYHAKDWRSDERKDAGFLGRNTRIQPFTWNKDGSPHFGHPIPSEVPLPKPSGE
jgi:GH43 family beta-xylosidase